jgi:hypothetical protein
MQEIIPPVSRELILKELNPERFLRKTNNADNEIYVITHHDSPNVMMEIGRLRELAFRTAGGGTGKEVDIDEFDTAKVPYKQLIVWDPDEQEIVGGYRYILCSDAHFEAPGVPHLATSELFIFSPPFLENEFKQTIELGRSFVQPLFQPSAKSRKGIFSLDNLWDGLGALIVDHPQMKYFFGKVTMYEHFNQRARDMILYFMNRFFPDPDKFVYPIKPLPIHTPVEEFAPLFNGTSFDENHKVLFQQVRALGENIPPLFNSYMSLSPSMRTFGTALNDTFGDVEETGILVTIHDIYPAKKERHVTSYHKYSK